MVRAVDKVELDARMEYVDPTHHPMWDVLLSVTARQNIKAGVPGTTPSLRL